MLHIYIVSLRQDVEKRKFISETLEDLGLKFSFINAVYGKDLSDDVLHSIRAKSAGKPLTREFPLTPGEIGCTLSHLKVYQNILDNGLDWACVLEDDVILDERFEAFINTFDSRRLDSEQLYLLGGQNGLANNQVVKSFKNIKKIGGQSFSKTIRSEQFIYRTCCYLISSDLAKSLMELSDINFILADDWEYLVRKNVISTIYLADFVDHPLDLSVSRLKEERDAALLERNLNSKKRHTSLCLRIKKAIKWRCRVSLLKTYRYLEKKDVF